MLSKANDLLVSLVEFCFLMHLGIRSQAPPAFGDNEKQAWGGPPRTLAFTVVSGCFSELCGKFLSVELSSFFCIQAPEITGFP